MAAFLADHIFEDEAVAALIAMGHDAVTVRSVGLDRATDRENLDAALSVGRAILSHDRDFIHLHKLGLSHAGIVFATRDNDFVALAVRIHAAVSLAVTLAGQLLRIYRPI